MKNAAQQFKLPHGEIKARVYNEANKLVKLVMLIDKTFVTVPIPEGAFN